MDTVGGSMGVASSLPQSAARSGIDQGFKSQLEEVLTVSSHAKTRLKERGIQFGAQELSSVSRAVDKARQAGSKTAAVVTASTVLVVSPATRTVITALPLNQEGQSLTMINRVDTLVFAGRTSTSTSTSTSMEETQRSGRTEGAQAKVAGGHWSLLSADNLSAGKAES